MRNLILHSITNRNADFLSPLFPTSDGFIPGQLAPDVEALRQFLQLAHADTDYFVVGLLNAIDAFPMIRNSFGVDARTYSLAALTPPPPQTTNCKLHEDQTGPARLARIPVEFPTALTLELAYFQPNMLQVALGSTTYNVPVLVNGWVYPTWPVGLGVSGALECNWEEGFTGELRFWPSGFPFAAAAAALDAFAPKNAVLQASGLVDPYYLAQSAVEKVAITALALGLQNPSV